MNDNAHAHAIELELLAGHTVSTCTSGASMQPLLYGHDTRIIIEPLAGRELRVGDLPVFRRGEGRYVVHRVVGIGRGCYYTRGDNCIERETVAPDDMLGIVTEIYRRGRHILVTDRLYRLYVKFWMAIYPLRAAKRRLGGFYRRFVPRRED